MIGAIAVLACFAIIAWVVVGLARPDIALRWAKEENQTRKNVMIYGIVAIAIDFSILCQRAEVLAGERAITPYVVAEGFFSVGFLAVLAWGLIGLIDPARAIRWGAQKRRNRKWVLAYFVIFFIAVVQIAMTAENATITPQERAMVAEENAARQQKKLVEQQAEQEQEEMKKQAAAQEKAKAAAEEAAKKEAAAAEEAKKNEQQAAATAEPAASSSESSSDAASSDTSDWLQSLREKGIQIAQNEINDQMDLLKPDPAYQALVYSDTSNIFGYHLNVYVDDRTIEKDPRTMSARVWYEITSDKLEKPLVYPATYTFTKGVLYGWNYSVGDDYKGDVETDANGKENKLAIAVFDHVDDYGLIDKAVDKVKSWTK